MGASFCVNDRHPNGRCYATPILKTHEKVIEDNKRILRGEEPLDPSKSQNYVGEDDLPQGFKDWVTNNSERIEIARNRGTLPYFVKDNEDMVNGVLQKQGVSKLKSIADFAKNRHVEYNGVGLLEKQLTSQELINKLGTVDPTTGSCASVALAYAGNRAGYDVVDFRGGKSMDFFSSGGIHSRIATNVGGLEERDKSEFRASNRLLSQMEKSKEYFFNPGKHAAIVRLAPTGEGYEYLELQRGVENNGWHKLDKSVLKERFECMVSRKYAYPVNLIDIEFLAKDSAFRELLGYINAKK